MSSTLRLVEYALNSPLVGSLRPGHIPSQYSFALVQVILVRVGLHHHSRPLSCHHHSGGA
ncbi:MAG: hypothetical protein LBC61_01580 [Candidatus Peribacteria bacterium]|nr:hypothetical protein [Candidatus Peribacteria bacterium]